MDYYAGIDVSVEFSSVCIMDATGKVVRESKVASEPAALIAFLHEFGYPLARIGLEAGPLSQWLYAGLKEAGFAVELLETRHLRDAFRAMSVSGRARDPHQTGERMHRAQELGDADRQARRHAESEGCPRGQARRDHAPHAGRSHCLQSDSQARCAHGSRINREDIPVFGRVTTPAFPKRSPLAGTMDQARPPCGMCHQSTHP